MEMEKEMEMDGRNVQSDIEDQSLIVEIKDMEDKLRKVSSISEHRCIYRVPKHLRDSNEAAYVPRLVSLGPFHHGKEGLEAMEEHKLRCFKSFIDKHHIDLDALLKLMKKYEEKTREYYADPIALPSNQFVQVILVDAIFVINFLLEFHSPDSAVKVGSIYHEDFFRCEVSRDMMLMENQLPFFILNKILHSAKSTDGTRITVQHSVTELSEYLFTCDMKEEESVTNLCNCLFNCRRTDHKSDMEDLKSCNNASHFVDFQRLIYMPVEEMQEARCTKNDKNLNSRPFMRWRDRYFLPCAGRAETGEIKGKFKKIKSISKLHKVGVRFEVASGKRLRDIRFEHGVLYIPRIVVSDPTETIFRNLLAYDQCHYGPSPIGDYFVLMGMLIDTADDVDLLVKNKILHNDLPTAHEVSKVFNNLEKEAIYQERFYYSQLCNEINKYCEILWHKWMAALRQNYLDTPWKVISVIAAFILLVLTAIQTVYSVISP